MLNLPQRTNFNEIAKLILLVQANASEIVVCKMAPVLSRPQCVNINDGRKGRLGYDIKDDNFERCMARFAESAITNKAVGVFSEWGNA